MCVFFLFVMRSAKDVGLGFDTGGDGGNHRYRNAKPGGQKERERRAIAQFPLGLPDVWCCLFKDWCSPTERHAHVCVHA